MDIIRNYLLLNSKSVVKTYLYKFIYFLRKEPNLLTFKNFFEKGNKIYKMAKLKRN